MKTLINVLAGLGMGMALSLLIAGSFTVNETLINSAENMRSCVSAIVEVMTANE